MTNFKVFLGGTCNNSTWRDELIPLLEENNIDYFNPVVENWTEEDQANEEREKEICNVHLYVITPLMTGVFSIAELVHDSVQKDSKIIIFGVLTKDGESSFDDSQIKSLKAVAKMISKYAVPTIFDDFEKLIKVLLYAKNNQEDTD